MTDYHVDSSFPASKHISIPIDDVKIEQIYTIEDMLGGDEAGTTETDSKTDPKGSGGYTTIYRKY